MMSKTQTGFLIIKANILLFSSVLFLTLSLYGQDQPYSKGHIGAGVGERNPYGRWGLFYSRTLSSLPIEVKVGIGSRVSICVTGGGSLKFFDNKKCLSFYINSDYTYCFPGQIDYDYDSPQTIDSYKYSELQFLNTSLSTRWNFYKKNPQAMALQLKTGYSFLINSPSIVHTVGPNEHYGRVKAFTKGGVSIGLEFLLFIHWTKKE